MTWKVHLENLLRFGQMGYKMYVLRDNRKGFGYSFMVSPTMKTVESSVFAADTDFFLSDSVFGADFDGPDVRGFLQAMSDAAWEIGIKPKQIEDNSNELKATKYHLEDMRKLAGAVK